MIVARTRWAVRRTHRSRGATGSRGRIAGNPASIRLAIDNDKAFRDDDCQVLFVASMDQLLLIGLDFGSTTSSAIISKAQVLRNCSTGRMELGRPLVVYRSTLTFTPFANNLIDEQILAGHLDRWLREAGATPGTFASGGVIITGLAAQKSNVAAIEALVKQRVGDALFAVAE